MKKKIFIIILTVLLFFVVYLLRDDIFKIKDYIVPVETNSIFYEDLSNKEELDYESKEIVETTLEKDIPKAEVNMDNGSKNEISKSEISKDETNKDKGSKNETNKSEIIKNDEIKTNESQPKKQDTKVDKKPISTEKAKEKTISKINQNKEQSKKKEESGIIDSDGKSVKTENVKTIDPEPWIKIGISKEDYYSKPVHSWMRVDYPVSSCETISKCEGLCLIDAEELAYTENVSCIQVYTYSGNYLGEMLKRN